MFLLLAWEMSSFSFSAAMHFKLIKLVLNRSSPKMRIQSLKSGEVLFSPDRDNRFLQIVFALSRRPQVPFLKLLCTLAFNLSINMAINPPVQFLLMCLSFPFLSLPLAFSKIDFPSDQRPPPYPPTHPLWLKLALRTLRTSSPDICSKAEEVTERERKWERGVRGWSNTIKLPMSLTGYESAW